MLVTKRINETQTKIGEMIAFAGQLQEAAARLGTHTWRSMRRLLRLQVRHIECQDQIVGPAWKFCGDCLQPRTRTTTGPDRRLEGCPGPGSGWSNPA